MNTMQLPIELFSFSINSKGDPIGVIQKIANEILYRLRECNFLETDTLRDGWSNEIVGTLTKEELTLLGHTSYITIEKNVFQQLFYEAPSEAHYIFQRVLNYVADDFQYLLNKGKPIDFFAFDPFKKYSPTSLQPNQGVPLTCYKIWYASTG